jgi:hypothetical protein
VAAALGGGAGDGTVVAIVSGGNIDLTTFASLTGSCPGSGPISASGTTSSSS